MRYVYIAGPYTGDEEANVARALEAATPLLRAGMFPYVPHLSHFWEKQHPSDYEVWMGLDFGWVRRCDAVLRLPGKSSGADREVMLAEEIGIPVFRTVDEVLAWASDPTRHGTYAESIAALMQMKLDEMTEKLAVEHEHGARMREERDAAIKNGQACSEAARLNGDLADSATHEIAQLRTMLLEGARIVSEPWRQTPVGIEAWQKLVADYARARIGPL